MPTKLFYARLDTGETIEVYMPSKEHVLKYIPGAIEVFEQLSLF